MSLEEVAEIARTAAEQHGYEVVQVKVDPRRHVRLWIDRPPPPPAPPAGPGQPLPLAPPAKGITVDDCAFVTRAIGDALGREGHDPGGYHIDVQSPGVDRLLVREADFARFHGQEATVRLIRKRDDRANWKGTIEGFEGGCILLGVDGKQERFPLAEVHEARLVPRLPFGSPGQQHGSGRHTPHPHGKRGHRKRKRKRDGH